jgi:hypothetical protein
MSQLDGRDERGVRVDGRDVLCGAAALVAGSDDPRNVERGARLDIIPTHYLFSRVDKACAESGYPDETAADLREPFSA